MERVEFIDVYNHLFVRDNELKLRFEMGGDKNGEQRVNQVLQRFEEISNYIFGSKEVWVLLIIWDANGDNKRELVNGGFNIEKATNCYRGKIEDGLINKEKFDQDALDDAEILYIRYKHYSFNNILPMVYSKAGFELGFENTAGIVAYFLCFENQPVLLNLYDDRGMELLSHDKEIIDNVSRKFSKYLI